MILDSLTLKNFGIYAGEQNAVLAPPNERKPIVLFGGLNGGGKTTLLDAVQLSLYGPKARCAGRGRLSYRDYLRAMINRAAEPAEGAALELVFRRVVEGEVRYHRLVRSWRDNGRDIVDHVQAHTDGLLDKDLSEHWDEFIEGYIPCGIAHLFFFDAEQIKELAEGEHAAEILGTAIHTLLGLDIVDRLETDLIVLERRKRAEGRSAEDTSRIQQSEDDVKRMQHLLDEAQAERGVLGNEAGRLAKQVDEIEKRFRREGGDLFLIRAELEAERTQLKAEQARAEAALRDVAAGTAPLLIITGLLEETETLVRQDHAARAADLLNGALAERDELLLARLREQKVPAKYLEMLHSSLEEDRRQRQHQSGKSVFPEAGDHLPAELRHLRSSALPETRKLMEQKLEAISSLQERMTRLEMELARVPAEDAIAHLQTELEAARMLLHQKQIALVAQEDKVRLLARQVEDAERRHKRELGDNVEAQVDQEHVGRVLKHSIKMRDTLGKFRVAVIRKHAKRLERLVLESFVHLLRKSSLVTGLTIDPATFRIELVGGDGRPLPFERLSAGERQLLATSILWGLAKASGRPLPTIIDTPLGRLDSSHRRHLLERYFPVASHQVILLSTDEEIDEASLHHLNRFVGRSYELKYNEPTRSTVVTEGYFWNHETSS